MISDNSHKTPKPVWRTPVPTTQVSQPSSSLKPPHSTQFARTWHCATNNNPIDDIDVDFEGSDSSPTEVKAQRAAGTAHRGYDDLVEDNEKVDKDFNHLESQFVKHGKSTSNSHGQAGQSTTGNSYNIQEVEENDSPELTLKRPRAFTESTKHREAIVISSSGSEEDFQYHRNQDDYDHKVATLPKDASDLDSDVDDFIPSSPSHNRVSTSTIPRFKTPAAPASELPKTKPTFKPPPLPQGRPNSTFLPDTFSPSRRRGKRDYVPGGYADTVRNWVLELGTSIAKPSSSGQARTLRVANVRHDVEGRCATIQDERGEEYLLVSQQQQSDASSVEVGAVVEITGEGTSWAIGLGGFVDQHGAGMGRMEGSAVAVGDGAKSGRHVIVCVLWKLKQ